MLIFFKWSGSEHKEEESDGTDDTKERFIGKQKIQYLDSTASSKNIDYEIRLANILPSLTRRQLSAVGSCFLSCSARNVKINFCYKKKKSVHLYLKKINWEVEEKLTWGQR